MLVDGKKDRDRDRPSVMREREQSLHDKASDRSAVESGPQW